MTLTEKEVLLVALGKEGARWKNICSV